MKTLKVLILTLFALTLFNCSDYSDDEIPEVKFPLNIGNNWTYEKTSLWCSKEDSSAVDENTVYTDTTIIFSTKYQEVLKDTLLADTLHNDFFPAYMILNQQFKNNLKQTSGQYTNYRWNYEDGLYYYEKEFNWPDFKSNENKRFCYKNIYFNDVDELITILNSNTLTGTKEDNWLSVKLIEYPLEVKNEWLSDSESFPVIRKVIGTETIETPAGVFLSYAIQTFYDVDKDGKLDDELTYIQYFTVYGIVKTYIEVRNMENTSVQYPDGDGTFIDVFETELLTDYEIDINK